MQNRSVIVENRYVGPSKKSGTGAFLMRYGSHEDPEHYKESARGRWKRWLFHVEHRLIKNRITNVPRGTSYARGAVASSIRRPTAMIRRSEFGRGIASSHSSPGESSRYAGPDPSVVRSTK